MRLNDDKFKVFCSRADDTKFIYSEKATKIWQNLPVLSTTNKRQNFVKFFWTPQSIWTFNILRKPVIYRKTWEIEIVYSFKCVYFCIVYKNLYFAFAYRSGRTSRGAQVFERFGCAVDSERKFKAKNRIRTVISYHLLSALSTCLNWFMGRLDRASYTSYSIFVNLLPSWLV